MVAVVALETVVTSVDIISVVGGSVVVTIELLYRINVNVVAKHCLFIPSA